MDPNVIILPVDTKDLPFSPRFTPYDFLWRCKFSTLTNQSLNFTYSRTHAFRYKHQNKNPADKNRTHDFLTRRCAGYLLSHSGDDKIPNSTSPLSILQYGTVWYSMVQYGTAYQVRLLCSKGIWFDEQERRGQPTLAL